MAADAEETPRRPGRPITTEPDAQRVIAREAHSYGISGLVNVRSAVVQLELGHWIMLKHDIPGTAENHEDRIGFLRRWHLGARRDELNDELLASRDHRR